MPYAVTHVILTIVLFDIYRDYFAKKKFNKVYVLVAGIAGLLPDMDIPVGWFINSLLGTSYNFHRLYTHSLMYAILFLLIGTTIVLFRKHDFRIFGKVLHKSGVALFFFAISFGWLMHVALDCTFSGDGYLNFIPSIALNFCPSPFSGDVLAGFDAIILVLWLLHEQWRHEIKDYI